MAKTKSTKGETKPSGGKTPKKGASQGLAITPTTRRGLQPEHMGLVREEFIRRHIDAGVEKLIEKGIAVTEQDVERLREEGGSIWPAFRHSTVPLRDQITIIRNEVKCAIAFSWEISHSGPGPGEENEEPAHLEIMSEREPYRVCYSPEAFTMFGGTTSLRQPMMVRFLARPLLEDGANAAIETLADFLAHDDDSALTTNTLSWVGNRISHHLRRALLLKTLVSTDWNLGAVGKALRMGGAGNVTKAIRDLGLTAELEKARAEGKAKRGVKRG